MPISWPFSGRSELKTRAHENSTEAVFRNKLPLLASRSLGTATPDGANFSTIVYKLLRHLTSAGGHASAVSRQAVG